MVNVRKGIDTALANFVSGFINWNLKKGGKLADENQIKERLEVCYGCEKKGIVEPLPLVKMEGCTECDCPLATKARFTEIPVDGEVTAKKLLLSNGNQIVKCPLNKWAQIDEKYEKR